MTPPGKVLIEITPGSYLFNIIDEDGIALFAEKYLLDASDRLQRIRQFTAPEVRDMQSISEIRKKIDATRSSLVALATLLHEAEEKSEGGGFTQFF